MLNVEIVTVMVGGSSSTEFERVTVNAGMDQAARDFQMELAEHPGQWKYKPGTEIEIRSNGDLLCHGYTNAYQASGGDKSHRILVQGRSKGQDFVDSSAEHETGFLEESTPLDAANAVNKFGIGISSDIELEKHPYLQLKQGETAYQFIERYLRPEGATMMGEPNGDIKITNASKAKHHFGILMEGPLGNIKSFDVDLNDGSRHSHYSIKGQSRKGTGAASLRVHQMAKDSGVKRHRPKMIASETDTDNKRAKKRAHHEKERAAGKAIQAAITTQSFRDFRGELWTPGKLIYVHSPILMHLSMTMLIERVTYTFDKSGSQTKLSLVDPRAYKGKGGDKAGGGGGKTPSGIDPEVPDDEAETDPAWTDGYADEEAPT